MKTDTKANDFDEAEIWKPIPGYPRWQVSTLGRAKGPMFKERIMKTLPNPNGYHFIQVSVRGSGIRRRIAVHRAVLLTFVGDSKKDCNHINGIKSDNRLANLEYCNDSENQIHALKLGLRRILKGEAHPSAKLNEEKVREIRKSKELNPVLAAKYGVSFGTISDIKKGKRWKHVK